MARATSDELQKLVQTLVETFDAHLEVVRRDVAAQQEAMVHEVRSLHEATIRAMAELRAAVHRVELALHDQFAALEPTPAAGIARPHFGAAPTHPGPATAVAPRPEVAPMLATRPVAQPAPARPTPEPAPAAESLPEVAAHVTATAPSPDTAAATPGVPTLAPRPGATPPAPAETPSPAATSTTPGLDVDRLVAMLETRLGEIDMTSGTSPD
jgi:hypothetical protein